MHAKELLEMERCDIRALHYSQYRRLIIAIRSLDKKALNKKL